MINFTTYLQRKKYSNSTITSYCNIIKRVQQQLTLQNLTYIQTLDFVKQLQQQQYPANYINKYLKVMAIYMQYLIDTDVRADNPILGIHIKGQITKLKSNLLTADELEDLYYSYTTDSKDHRIKASKLRDKVIIGCIVYQGITPNELHKLQIEHLRLQTGKIIIPATRKGNTRTLQLKPSQIIDLMNYTTKSRELLKSYNKATHNEQLFYSTLHQMHHIIKRSIKKLKQYNQKVENHTQLRASVITLWIQQYELRTTQYMAGHRTITGTEKYLQNNIDDLHQMVNTLHPIQ